MKKTTTIITVIVAALTAIATLSSCVGRIPVANNYETSATPTSTPTAQETTPTAPPVEVSTKAPETEPTDPYTHSFDDYIVKYIGAEVVDTDDGVDVIISYEFTNNGKDKKSFSWAISSEAYQDGVELERDYLYGFLDDFEDNVITDILPGATIEVKIPYELKNTTGTITARTSYIWDFGDTEYMTIDIPLS